MREIRRELNTLVDKGILKRARHGFYCLATQSVEQLSEDSFQWSMKTSNCGSSRKKTTVTVAEAILKILTLLVHSRQITKQELVIGLGIEQSTIMKAITRLQEECILEVDSETSIRIAPQEKHEIVQSLQTINQCDTWVEVIKSIILEYLETHLHTSHRNIQRLFRIRRNVRKRLPFLYPAEVIQEFQEAFDELCMNGVMIATSGDWYRFVLAES